MRYAIDRYVAGKECEVAASEFYGKYIPQKHGRFFCPECGEPVYWRSRGGSNPDVFYHKEKTDRTPECDKRVDGRSDLSLIQRVGLPLYLVKEHEGVFRLNLSFPALGQHLFEKLYAEEVVVRISAGNMREKTFPINAASLYVNDTTLIPVDFFPDCGRNYRISVSSSKWSFSVGKRWADYADGFESGGGIFICSDNGGKKVHRGDSIAIGQKYFLVTRNYDSPYYEIQTRVAGKVYLNRQEHTVYTLVVNVSTADTSRFFIINSYVKRTFGVWLLEKVPELIPLWPPVVLQEEMVPVVQTDKVYCSVISGNDDPKVYLYTPSGVNEVSVYAQGISRTVTIPLRNDLSVSVDRKYIGRELNFSSSKSFRSEVEPLFLILNEEGTLIDEASLTTKELESGFVIKANLKAEAFVESIDCVCQRVVIRQEKTVVPERRNPHTIILVSEGVILHKLEIIAPIRIASEQRAIEQKDLITHCHGAYLSIPRWAIRYINDNEVLRLMIRNGKLRRGVLMYLSKLKEASK